MLAANVCATGRTDNVVARGNGFRNHLSTGHLGRIFKHPTSRCFDLMTTVQLQQPIKDGIWAFRLTWFTTLVPTNVLTACLRSWARFEADHCFVEKIRVAASATNMTAIQSLATLLVASSLGRKNCELVRI